MTTAELEKKIEETTLIKGKLVMIQELSDWLYSQPQHVSQVAILQFLMDKAGELA